MSEYSYMWQLIKIRVCQNSKIPLNETYTAKSHAGEMVKLRVLQIFTLECILNEYRRENATPFAPLTGEAALQHMIFIKTKWPLTTIRKLSLQDALFIINDQLHISKLPKEAQIFIENQGIQTNGYHIATFPNEDWNPKENSVFFQEQSFFSDHSIKIIH